MNDYKLIFLKEIKNTKSFLMLTKYFIFGWTLKNEWRIYEWSSFKYQICLTAHPLLCICNTFEKVVVLFKGYIQLHNDSKNISTCIISACIFSACVVKIRIMFCSFCLKDCLHITLFNMWYLVQFIKKKLCYVSKFDYLFPKKTESFPS